MEKPKVLLLALSLLLLGLAITVLYNTASDTLSPDLSRSSDQEVVTVGDELAASFRLYNPSGEKETYLYALYLDDNLRFERVVTINPRSEFTFGGRYRSLKPGLVKVTALVYENESKRTVKNVTYYVNVTP